MPSPPSSPPRFVELLPSTWLVVLASCTLDPQYEAVRLAPNPDAEATSPAVSRIVRPRIPPSLGSGDALASSGPSSGRRLETSLFNADAGTTFEGITPSRELSPRGLRDAAAPDGRVEDAAEPAPDAASAQARDAGSNGSLGDSGISPCSTGAIHYVRVCWHLAEPATSCAESCRDRGGVDPAASATVGTPEQGGSASQCGSILQQLGLGEQLNDRGEAESGQRSDGVGAGCHLFGEERHPWWLTEPPFSPDASLPNARQVCGCRS